MGERTAGMRADGRVHEEPKKGRRERSVDMAPYQNITQFGDSLPFHTSQIQGSDPAIEEALLVVTPSFVHGFRIRPLPPLDSEPMEIKETSS